MTDRRFLGTDVSETELLAAVARGELGALGEIYRRHGAAVLGAARKLVADPEEAEKATAEVFVELWDCAGDPRPGDLRTYLIARVAAITDGTR